MKTKFRYTSKGHAPWCSCKDCGPAERWAVYDGKKVYSVDTISRVEMARIKDRQLKEGRYWIKWEEVPQVHREAWMGTRQPKELDIFHAFVADCPFCGCAGFLTFDAAAQSGLRFYYVVCTNHYCGCALTGSLDPKAAIQKWNRRIIALRAVALKDVEPDGFPDLPKPKPMFGLAIKGDGSTEIK